MVVVQVVIEAHSRCWVRQRHASLHVAGVEAHSSPQKVGEYGDMVLEIVVVKIVGGLKSYSSSGVNCG